MNTIRPHIPDSSAHCKQRARYVDRPPAVVLFTLPVLSTKALTPCLKCPMASGHASNGSVTAPLSLNIREYPHNSTGHPTKNRDLGSAGFLIFHIYEAHPYFAGAEIKPIPTCFLCTNFLINCAIGCTTVTGRACVHFSASALFRVYSCWWTLTPKRRAR